MKIYKGKILLFPFFIIMKKIIIAICKKCGKRNKVFPSIPEKTNKYQSVKEKQRKYTCEFCKTENEILFKL